MIGPGSNIIKWGKKAAAAAAAASEATTKVNQSIRVFVFVFVLFLTGFIAVSRASKRETAHAELPFPIAAPVRSPLPLHLLLATAPFFFFLLFLS